LAVPIAVGSVDRHHRRPSVFDTRPIQSARGRERSSIVTRRTPIGTLRSPIG